MDKENAIEHFTKRMNRIAKLLNKVVTDARKIWPEANLYLEEDTLHLMSGDTHDPGAFGKPRHDRVLTSNLICGMDGGGW